MPLDNRVRRFLDVLAASQPKGMADQSVAERRKGLQDLMKCFGPAYPVRRTQDTVVPGASGELRARIYTPMDESDEPLPGLVYFHGGGLVAGSIDTHDSIARALSSCGGCRVVSVGYRIGPEFRFPAAVNDAIAAVRHVSREADALGIDRGRIGVAGDSAGATLAAAVCDEFGRTGEVALGGQVLLCPILDHATGSASRRDCARGYLVDDAVLAHDLAHYLDGDVTVDDVRVSPGRAVDLSRHPPTVIHTAEFDPLRDEGRAYADRLAASGVPCRYTCHPGMIHLFYALGAAIPHARTAFYQLGSEIRALLAPAANTARSGASFGPITGTAGAGGEQR